VSAKADLAFGPGQYAELAAQAARDARAPATWAAYKSTWRSFVTFCEAAGIEAAPSAQAACAYALHLAELGRASSTIDRAMTALGQVARARGLEPPTADSRVAEVLAGLRRRIGTRPARKAALTPRQVRDMLEGLPAGKRGLRDRCMLLLGFAGAFRRSELVAVDVEHLQWCDEGVRVLVPRSKTDQTGEGMTKAIPPGRSEQTCPVRSLRAWLEASSIESGPVFRHVAAGDRVTGRRIGDRQVARLVQSAAKRAGIEADLAAHSLRAGLITAAAKAGRSDWSIMRQSGHASPATLAAYVREARLFDDNAAEGLL